MVVLEIKIGNAVVRIHDDCLVKTNKEREAVLEQIANMAARHYRQQKEKTI